MGSLIYLLDTNILSEPVKSEPNSNVMAHLAQFRENCATASIVWHELHFGLARMPASKKSRMIADYLAQLHSSHLPVLEYDSRAAEWHASERARLIKKGISLPFADGQIAAIAKVNSLKLATRNTADFAYFDGLEVGNWFEAKPL